MNVLFLTRRNPNTFYEGDVMSLHQTARELESLGIRTTISDDPAIPFAPFDLIHLYTLDYAETPQHLLQARRQGKRVVTTPVYWRRQYDGEMQERLAVERPHFDAATMHADDPARRALMHWLDEHAERAIARWALDTSELVFVKSHAEGEMLAQDFDTLREKMRLAPNGIDGRFAHGDAARFRNKYREMLGAAGEFVLCVARIDLQKNIPNLLRAWRDETIPLILIGARTNPGYFEQCRSQAGPHTHFLDPLSAQDLADAYAAARVHVLASWWEQVGRSAMEAGMAGCNLVMTQNSPAREYFGADCFLCDPADPTSIHAAIRAAYDAPHPNNVAARLQEHFSWAKTARMLADAYRAIPEHAEPMPIEMYAERLRYIAALRAEAWQLRELHYNVVENQARELRTWVGELQAAHNARARRANPLHIARGWFKRV